MGEVVVTIKMGSNVTSYTYVGANEVEYTHLYALISTGTVRVRAEMRAEVSMQSE